jgi:hypothetical protein
MKTEQLKITIANGPQSRGTYKHLTSRDMLADLAKVRPWRRTLNADASVEVLAKRARDHYLEVATRSEPGAIMTDIHVFPAKKTGHSADFRRHLAAYLVGHDPDAPIWLGSRSIYKLDQLRAHFEDRLRHFGFRFVEVNPDHWKGGRK